MNARIVLLLALLGLLLLAGCTFKSKSGDDGSDTTLSAGDSNDDDNKDSPSASVGAVLSVLGAALLVRRRLGSGPGAPPSGPFHAPA